MEDYCLLCEGIIEYASVPVGANKYMHEDCAGDVFRRIEYYFTGYEE
jgi:hypothetical protein